MASLSGLGFRRAPSISTRKNRGIYRNHTPLWTGRVEHPADPLIEQIDAMHDEGTSNARWAILAACIPVLFVLVPIAVKLVL